MNMAGFKGMEQDHRVRYFINPERIVWQDARGGKIENPQALLTNDASCCEISSQGGGSPAVILDFGRELNGGICLGIHFIAPKSPAKFHLRFGESVSEVMGTPTLDHAVHDWVLDIPSLSTQEFGLTGFRFVLIELLSPETKVQIDRAQAVALEQPWKYEGAFECSDPRLNEIWKVCARTVHLCSQEYMLDGIKRDRLVWMGDIHPQVRVMASVFGNKPIVKQSLKYLCDRTDANGWLNGISSYSMWWIISVWDWFMATGDRSFLMDQKSYLEALVERFSKKVDETGREQLDGWRFIDWAGEGNKKAADQGLQALLTWAMRDAALIAGELGNETLAKFCTQLATKMASLGDRKNFANKQAGAISVLAGIADPKQTNAECLSVNSCAGLSPWCGYYVLEARAMAGDYAGAIDVIRKYWGGMLDLGATSIWEHFNIDWLKDAGRIDEIVPAGKHDVHAEYGDHCYVGLRHSLCHAWGAGPAAWLNRYVLGVEVLEPGMKAISIKAHLGDLEWAQGTVPSPFGPIHVRHRKNADGTVGTECDCPESIEVRR
jgi:hypothetical protein